MKYITNFDLRVCMNLGASIRGLMSARVPTRPRGLVLLFLTALLSLSWSVGARASSEGARPPIPLDIPLGYMIIEGDIQVPIANYVLRIPWATNFWPNGIVPFEFDANVTQANRTAMLTAMQQWQNVANVTFRVRTNENDYVHIQNSTGNNSPVGRQGGQQIINITSWGATFAMAHELAHTLGSFHEQSRPDRDTYVRINTQNIQPGLENNFNRESNAGFYGPYDFDSVMHYGRCDFTRCSVFICTATCDTITVLPPNESWQTRIGQRDHLSKMDKLIMSFLYPQPNWRFVDRSFSGSEDGSFLRPYKQFTTGANAVPAGGTLWIQPGSYVAIGVYNRPMTLQAPLGGVTLGTGN